jgi:hypothetical protein
MDYAFNSQHEMDLAIVLLIHLWVWKVMHILHTF